MEKMRRRTGSLQDSILEPMECHQERGSPSLLISGPPSAPARVSRVEHAGNGVGPRPPTEKGSGPAAPGDDFGVGM